MLKGEQMMRILVDADACPVIGIVERIAKAHGILVTLLCDTNHVLKSDYSDVKVIGAGADAVDFGVAALALGKGAFAICQSGMLYTQDNIDQMLMERHLARKARMGKGKHHLKGPKKRTREEDEAFEKAFADLLGGMDNRKM